MTSDSRATGSVVVLAGGRSRRIGSDKAFLKLGGRSILERLLTDATAGFADVVLVANDLSRYSEALVSYGWPRERGLEIATHRRGKREIRLLADHRPGLGPLAGLEVGLNAARSDRCWVLGCDFPFIVEEVGRRLLTGLEETPGAVVPLVNDRLQTLCAAVRSDAHHVATDCLDNGRHRMTDLLDRIGFQRIAASDFEDLGDPARLFLNLNRTADLERALRWVG